MRLVFEKSFEVVSVRQAIFGLGSNAGLLIKDDTLELLPLMHDENEE